MHMFFSEFFSKMTAQLYLSLNLSALKLPTTARTVDYSFAFACTKLLAHITKLMY